MEPNDDPAATTNEPPWAGIWEREDIARSCRRLLDTAREGHGGTLFVVAEAGLGKTTVLDHACRLAEPDFRVGQGRADAMETWIPFGLLEQAVGALGGQEILAPGSGSSPSDERAGRCLRTLRWLEELSTQPVLVALDDLHWADPDSLALLLFLCRRIGSLPVAVIATLRPWPRAAADLASSVADSGLGSIERLGPLSERATKALMAARVGRPVPEGVTKRAFELCAGNPLLLQTVAAGVSRGEELPEPDEAEPGQIRAQLLLARFAGVSPTGLRLAQGASVFGTAFWPQLAAEVAHLEEGEVDDALDALCGAGLVRAATTARAEFVHPLFRHVLYEDLAQPVRARLHSRAFTALAERGMELEAAAHAMRAELVGYPDAVAVLQRSGREALAGGAFATALGYLERAAAFAGTQASTALLMALGEALLASGRLSEAAAVCERLLARPDLHPTTTVSVLRMLARAFALQGAHGEARARFQAATTLAQAEHPDSAVEVLVDHALASWLTGGPATALPLATRARELASHAHADVARRAEAAWGFIAALFGDPSGSEALAAAARPVLDDVLSHLSELYWAWGTLSVYGMAAGFTERFGEAEEAFTRGLWAAERVGAAEAFANLSIPYAGMLSRLGRLDEALTLLGRAGTLSELAPMNETYVAVGHAYVLMQMGRWEESESWCERVEAKASERGEWVALLYLWDIRGQQRLMEGRVDEACDLYSRCQQATSRLGVGEPCAVPWARHAIRAYLAGGRDREARGVVAWLDECVGRLPCRWPRIVAATGRALLAERARDHDAAGALFGDALSLHADVELPLERGETLLDFGAFLRRRGRLGEGRGVLAQALELADDRGAGWLGTRARTELAAAGGRRRHDKHGTLTPREERVATLAASGLSNKEIASRLAVSEGTVETHLGHVYGKLAIHSRRQLMAFADQEDGLRTLGDTKDQGNP